MKEYLILTLILSITFIVHAAEIDLGVDIYTPKENVDPYELDVLDSYEESVELEREVTELYKEICAAKLSRIQRQNMRKSLKQTIVPLSERLKVNEKLLRGKAANSADVETYQEELQRLMQENDAIVANAEEMLMAVIPEQKPMPEESVSDALEELLDEMSQTQESDDVNENIDQPEQLEQTMDIKQQMEQLENKTQEKMDQTVDSLELALIEMKQAEKKIEEKIEEMQQHNTETEDVSVDVIEENNQVEIDQQTESEITEEESEEPLKKDTEKQKIEEIKENLQFAKVAVKEAIEAIEEKKETVDEKIEQARDALEKIAEILEDVQKIQQQIAMEKVDPPQENMEKSEEEIQKSQEQMKQAAEMLLMLSKLQELSEQQLSKDKQIAQQQVMGELAKAESGKYLDVTEQMKGNINSIPKEVKESDRPPKISAYFKDVPGRKVVKNGGTPVVWFYVDSWYLLGPYDNKGRMNIQKVYPPESIIDLDANYLGKYNQRLSWIFDSYASENRRPQIYPAGGTMEYTIFYGYTELYFEEPTDAWIAVGSDDRSDLWINDLPVWYSSNQLKSWRIDEGFRKVHFKQGKNKVVFRLENGWHAMNFSLLINLINPE